MITSIIPSHNDASEIEKTIRSCEMQDSIKEIIVIDDCSDDKNSSLLFRICLDYRCKYIKNEINYGLAGSRNKAIEEARYDWVIPIDTGDYFYFNGVDWLWSIAEEDTFLSDVYYGNITDKYDTNDKRHHVAKPVENITKESFKENPLFCSSLFSKEIWKMVNGYTMRPYSFYEDFDMWCKMISIGAKFKYCDVLTYHHTNDGHSMLSELHKHTDKYKELSRLGLEYGENKNCYKPFK